MIMSSNKKKFIHMMEEEKMDSSDIALQSAADDILNAITRRDSKALIESLKAFIELCDDECESESEILPE